MALSSIILLTMLFGILEMSLALYSYHYISEAAREGSRYAIVRGSTSCQNTPNLTNCGATAAQIQTYVMTLGFPGINSTQYMTVTTTWLNASATQPTTWSTCTSGTCNAPGNAVKVTVYYAFPLKIPFLPATTLNMSSTSQMVISQ
jgi:Flp pilus assembly protein TadG